MKPVRLTFDQAAPHLKVAMGEDAQYIERDVRDGIAHCWKLKDLYAITRPEGDELVFVCSGGSGLRELAPQIALGFKQAGYKTMRFHAKRKGVQRLLSHIGFEEKERVYGVKL